MSRAIHKQKILITGITGFLGSHIAEKLISDNYQVIGIMRKQSSIWRCEEFKENIKWIEINDFRDLSPKLSDISFDAIIHCAWLGVEANQRDEWLGQSYNVNFLVNLLEASKYKGLKQIIFMGSQAEYGFFNGKISEEDLAEPKSAYGAIKIACGEILKAFCEENGINWVHLRLFPIFGEKEGENWLIPSLIKNIKTEKYMDLTPCEQKYAYLYVKDFAKIIHAIISNKINSGIYNISSENAIAIKELLTYIKNKLDKNFNLNFGKLDYRKHQSMHMEGDIKKLKKEISIDFYTERDEALNKVINYYDSLFRNCKI